MPWEIVRDNQWWYAQSPLRARVDGAPYATLSIGGRECPMSHSVAGRDGRQTYSFKFLRDADREFWVGLRGQQVEIDVVRVEDAASDLDHADDDDSDGPVAVPVDRASHCVPLPEVGRGGPTLFDAYVFVDWSANSRKKSGPDSIWIAQGAYDEANRLVIDAPYNPATRRAAEAHLLHVLLGHVARGRRVLVGFDFPYGYPAGWHAIVGREDMQGDWRDLWSMLSQAVVDGDDNSNNRCAVTSNLNAAVPAFVGPYWTRPNKLQGMLQLPPTKPSCFRDGVVAEYRQIEVRLRDQGLQPKSVWQLYGAGTVGSQAVLGIPVVDRLRQHADLRSSSLVWPFETGWDCPERPQPLVLHAEIWPGAVPLYRQAHPVKDAAQMMSYVHWAADLDSRALLRNRFNPFAETATAPQTVQTSEGWILR
jgi:hypothetical protein